MLSRPRVATLVTAVFLALAVAACGVDRRNPLRPSASSSADPIHARPAIGAGTVTNGALAGGSETGGGFYPLAIGNAWTYDSRFEITLMDSAGNALSGESESDVIDRNEHAGVAQLAHRLEQIRRIADDLLFTDLHAVRVGRDRVGK